jgi:hypothetical protein
MNIQMNSNQPICKCTAFCVFIIEKIFISERWVLPYPFLIAATEKVFDYRQRLKKTMLNFF